MRASGASPTLIPWKRRHCPDPRIPTPWPVHPPNAIHIVTNFPTSGLYKLWAQFQQSGRVITLPFVLRVEAAAALPREVPQQSVKIIPGEPYAFESHRRASDPRAPRTPRQYANDAGLHARFITKLRRGNRFFRDWTSANRCHRAKLFSYRCPPNPPAKSPSPAAWECIAA